MAAPDRIPVYLRVGDADEVELGTIGVTSRELDLGWESPHWKRRIAHALREAADHLEAQANEDGA